MPSYRYQCLDCLKTHIGFELPGGMTCNCSPPKKIKGYRVREATIVRRPLSDKLLAIVTAKESGGLRSVLCKRWNINNKSHKSHGTNFSSNQKLVDLIHDIVAPVRGGLIASVREAIIRDYQYDYVTGEMV